MKIQITKQGGIEMLHNDRFCLQDFGKYSVVRASHVEFCDEKQQWYVQSAKTLKVLGYFPTRQEALTWEADYYAPGGEGWGELCGRK